MNTQNVVIKMKAENVIKRLMMQAKVDNILMEDGVTKLSNFLTTLATKVYTDEQLAELDTTLRAYAHTEANNAEISAKDHGTSVANAAESNAKAYADAKIEALIGEGSLPERLDTLIEFVEWIVAHEEDFGELVDNLEELTNTKVDKVDGKELSANDFTDAYLNALENLIEAAKTAVLSVNGRTGAVVLTKDDVGLGSYPDAPASLPVSDATKTYVDGLTDALDAAKVDKVTGKDLSDENFTATHKAKLESGYRVIASETEPADFDENTIWLQIIPEDDGE